ncbi:hypothetical protein LCGC14_1388100 [marine sediment metagenome]|uniref:Uncharacterized protein n=1 Tax=marine sediment metagenome TaxID=412755 RepID=A0A0F9KLJ3_9ZZZZ
MKIDLDECRDYAAKQRELNDSFWKGVCSGLLFAILCSILALSLR